MISNQQISDYIISNLKPYTVTSAINNSKYRTPVLVENLYNTDHLSTHDETTTDVETLSEASRKYVNIVPVDKYRYNGKWFTYHESADHPEETFLIFKVDEYQLGTFFHRVNKKSFIGRIDRLVFQKLIEPFIFFIDYKFISWDNIDIVYDCDDIWILVRTMEYSNYSIRNKPLNMVILPYPCDFLGEEPDWLFDLNYNALQEYLQETSIVSDMDGNLDTLDDKEFRIKSPTMDTEYEYNHMMFNVGGWLYTQIKKYNLGILPQSRIDRLQSFTVYKYTKNKYGVTVDTLVTKYNGLDKDVPTNKALFDALYYMPLNKYNNYPMLRFNENGLQNDNGKYKIVIIDENVIYQTFSSSEDKIVINLSNVNSLLFRDNYLVFDNGFFSPRYQLYTSINNISLCDNPDCHNINIKLIYHKDIYDVIRTTDRFSNNYIDLQAELYLQYLYYTHHPRRELPYADTMPDHRIYKELDVEYNIDSEMRFIPELTESIVFLNNSDEKAADLVTNIVSALDFKMERNLLYEDNVENAIDSIVDFDPMLLNGIYHTFVDSKTFTGKQAKASLVYTFMYENKRGLKIPRKLYKNHETYIMVFVNGELIENYSRMIAYANFFFIPLDNNQSFNDDDVIEVLFFKNVNNNEIAFELNLTHNPSQFAGVNVNTDALYNIQLEGLENNLQDYRFYNMEVFQPYIRPKELCIFSYYPKYMIKYPTLITNPEEEVAFNVSYRDDDNNLCIKGESIKHVILDEPLNEFNDNDKSLAKQLVATSKHKFIYQRLYIDKRSYRIRLDKRFRFCNNQNQYVLFVNGRKMMHDSYLVTVPKHTRPFNNIYLYTARFVNPEDRIELFYLPYSMEDINITDKYELDESGYFTFNRSELNVPLSKDLYLFFINGKKIPRTHIIDIDSNTIRVAINTNTLNYITVIPINIDTLPDVVDYMQDNNKISKYDFAVDYFRLYETNTVYYLNALFNCNTSMTDNEDDKIWVDVGRIAILNEIIRDFWVTSGYEYQKKLFVYDYFEDELFEQDSSGNLMLPSLDATPYINIIKNDITLLYFYTRPKDLLYEMGDVCNSCDFYWDYSQRLNEDWIIQKQTLNDVELDVNDRSYTWVENINSRKKFTFKSNTGYNYIVHEMYLDFVNGIYWGTIDEDELQYYRRRSPFQYVDGVMAVIPRNGLIPTVHEQTEFTDNRKLIEERLLEENYLIRGLSYTDNSTDQSLVLHPLVDEPIPNYTGYYNENDLSTIIRRLDKHLCRNTNIKLNDYVIGNNNYFLFACPTRYVYNNKWEWIAEFFFPDPNGEDIVAHCRDDKTTPVYTDGNFDHLNNTLIKLYEMKMEFMGECVFTNDFGYTERYCVWKTNGFFTRLFDNYGFDITIRTGNYSDLVINYINTKESNQYTMINYIDGIEEIEQETDVSNMETTHNAEPVHTTTVSTTDTANTVVTREMPNDRSIPDVSLEKTNTRTIHSTSNAPVTMFGNSNVSDAKAKELLDKGIFLI